MKFAERLRKLRIEKNLRQDELAKVLNISRQSVSNYENGARFPKDEVLIHKISKFFNVSIDYLLGATNIRASLSNGVDNLLMEKKDNSYSQDKKDALEELFLFADRLPKDDIIKITHVIKLFLEK